MRNIFPYCCSTRRAIVTPTGFGSKFWSERTLGEVRQVAVSVSSRFSRSPRQVARRAGEVVLQRVVPLALRTGDDNRVRAAPGEHLPGDGPLRLPDWQPRRGHGPHLERDVEPVVFHTTLPLPARGSRA
eukprot:5965134-Pyramimonas_sp.AAC.1